MSKQDVTKTDRNIDSLLPVARTAIKLFFQECHKAGINIFVTETYRSQARQNYIYEQGRTRLYDSKGNKLKIVTWTKNSRHTSKLAWDIAASTLNGNKDIYNVSILKKAGAIAMKLGITWGGQPSWVKEGATDYPHFEVKSNWTIPKGYKLEGVISIPTSSNSPIKVVSSVNKLPQVELQVSDSKNNTKLDVQERKIQLLKDNTAPTLFNEFIADLEKAYANKVITDKKWLELAKSGKLTLADAFLLQCRIDKNK